MDVDPNGIYDMYRIFTNTSDNPQKISSMIYISAKKIDRKIVLYSWCWATHKFIPIIKQFIFNLYILHILITIYVLININSRNMPPYILAFIWYLQDRKYCEKIRYLNKSCVLLNGLNTSFDWTLPKVGISVIGNSSPTWGAKPDKSELLKMFGFVCILFGQSCIWHSGQALIMPPTKVGGFI